MPSGSQCRVCGSSALLMPQLSRVHGGIARGKGPRTTPAPTRRSGVAPLFVEDAATLGTRSRGLTGPTCDTFDLSALGQRRFSSSSIEARTSDESVAVGKSNQLAIVFGQLLQLADLDDQLGLPAKGSSHFFAITSFERHDQEVQDLQEIDLNRRLSAEATRTSSKASSITSTCVIA